MGKNSNFIDFENMEENVDVEKNLLSGFSQEDEILKAVVIQNNARAELDILLNNAKDEGEKLQLRNSVLQGNYTEDIKSEIIQLLDAHMRNELEKEINLANSLEEIKKDKDNLVLGVVAMVIIGFAASIIFPIAWLIGIVLAVVGYNSAKKEKEVELQEAIAASEKVERFRNVGYQI